MDGWMDGWMGGRVVMKAVLRIADINQKIYLVRQRTEASFINLFMLTLHLVRVLFKFIFHHIHIPKQIRFSHYRKTGAANLLMFLLCLESV